MLSVLTSSPSESGRRMVIGKRREWTLQTGPSLLSILKGRGTMWGEAVSRMTLDAAQKCQTFADYPCYTELEIMNCSVRIGNECIHGGAK